MEPSSQSESIEQTAYKANHKLNLAKSQYYMTNCYNSTAATANCLPLGRERIDWTITEDVDCAFSDGICRGDNVVQFDTGRLNSYAHFGINAAVPDQVEYRRVMTCAPLKTAGYVGGPLDQLVPGFWSFTDGEVVTLKYNYGPNLREYYGCPNWTLSYSNQSISLFESQLVINGESLNFELGYVH